MAEIDDSEMWVSATIGRDTYATTVLTEGHQLVADEPVDRGGKDLGPTPGDFIRMSLATCVAITLRMYANRKGHDVAQIRVKVRSEKRQAQTAFQCIVELTGNLDDATRTRMLQIAKLCPIHKTLTNPITVETTLV